MYYVFNNLFLYVYGHHRVSAIKILYHYIFSCYVAENTQQQRTVIYWSDILSIIFGWSLASGQRTIM